MGIARSAGRLVGKLANPSWKPPKPKPAWYENNNKITNIVARHRRGTNDFIVDSKSNNEHDLYILDHNPDKSSTNYKKVATIGNFSRIDTGNTRTRTQSENPMNSENRGITFSGLDAVVEHLRLGGYDVHALNKGDNAKKPVFQGKMVHPLSRHSTTYVENRYENYFRLKPLSDEGKENDRTSSTQNKPKPQVQKALEYNPSPPKAPPSYPKGGPPSASDGNRTTVRTRRRGKQGASVKNPTVTPADVEKLAEPPKESASKSSPRTLQDNFDDAGFEPNVRDYLDPASKKSDVKWGTRKETWPEDKVDMTPDEYLAITGNKSPRKPETLTSLSEAIAGGKEINPVSIRYDDKGKMIEQEGNHRAMAAKAAGAVKIPVYTSTWRETNGYYEPTGVNTAQPRKEPVKKNAPVQTPVEQAEAYVSQIPEGLKRDRNLGGNVLLPTKRNIETALNVDVTKSGDLDKLPIDMSQEEIANLDKAIAASAFGQSDLNQRASGVVDPNKKLSNAVGIYSRRSINNPETGEKTTVGNNELENYQIMAGVVKGIDSPETKRLQQVADALQYQKSQYDRADAVEGEGNASEANAIREEAKNYGWSRAAAVDTEGLGDASKVKGEIPTYLHEVSTGIMDRDPETGELANLEALKALNTGTSQYNKNMKDVRGPGLKTFGVPTNHISLDRDPNVRQNMIVSASDDETSDERAFQAYLANAEPSEDPGGYRIDAPEKDNRDLQPTSNIDRIAQGVATRIAGIYAPSKLNSLHASVSGDSIRIAKPGTFSTSEDEDGRQTSSGKWNRFTTENAEKSAWKGINDVYKAQKLAFDWTTNHVRDQYTENVIKYINSLSGDKKEKFVNNNVENILKNLIEQQRQGAISPETDTSGHPFNIFRAEDKRYDLGNFELADRLLNATPPLPASPIGGKGFTTEEIDRYLNPEKSTEFTNPLKAEIALTHNLDTERTEQYLNIMNSMPQTPGVINASETARRQLGMNKVKDNIATDLPQDMPDVVPDPVDPFERTYTPPADASEVPPDPRQAKLTKGLAKRSKAGNPDAQGSTPPVESPDQDVIANIENYLLPEQSALSQAAPVAKPAAAVATKSAGQAQDDRLRRLGAGTDVEVKRKRDWRQSLVAFARNSLIHSREDRASLQQSRDAINYTTRDRKLPWMVDGVPITGDPNYRPQIKAPIARYTAARKEKAGQLVKERSERTISETDRKRAMSIAKRVTKAPSRKRAAPVAKPAAESKSPIRPADAPAPPSQADIQSEVKDLLNPAQALSKEQTAENDSVGTFETAKGSTYYIHADGSTTRNKASRKDIGHEGDSGWKDRTSKTVYVTPDQAALLSLAGAINSEKHRIIIKDGKLTTLSWNRQAGKWGTSPIQRDIPFSIDPAVGLSPFDLWNPKDDVAGYEAYGAHHGGNAIISMSTNAQPSQADIIDQVNSHIAPGRGTKDRSGKVADTMKARASKTLQREANRNAIPLSFKKQVPKGYTAEVFQGKDSTGKDSTLTPKFVKRVTGSTGILREKVGKKNEYRVVSLTDTHYGLNAGTGLDEKHATRMAKLLDYLGRRAQRTTGGSNPMDAMVKNLESGMQYRTLFANSKRGRRPGNTQ